MKKHYYFILALLVYALAVVILNLWGNRTVAPAAGEGGSRAREVRAIEQFPGHGLGEKAKLGYLHQVHLRKEKLKEREAERTLKRQAAAKSMASRKQALWMIEDAWASLVETNMPKYRLLRAQANSDPTGQVPCTICDGMSYMPCIFCEGHRQCVHCDGTGKKVQVEYCAHCVGTGNCYLCSGFGKMFCPFCDDGAIVRGWPLPSKTPPLF